jgi:hypothetical protein
MVYPSGRHAGVETAIHLGFRDDVCAVPLSASHACVEPVMECKLIDSMQVITLVSVTTPPVLATTMLVTVTVTMMLARRYRSGARQFPSLLASHRFVQDH